MSDLFCQQTLINLPADDLVLTLKEKINISGEANIQEDKTETCYKACLETQQNRQASLLSLSRDLVPPPYATFYFGDRTEMEIPMNLNIIM